jgi:hypothetical protein
MEDLQKRVEKFLSSAEILTFSTDRDVHLANLYFGKHQYSVFKNNDHYYDLIKYFSGRKLKLVISEGEQKYNISLVDLDTSDIINIDKVMIIADGLIFLVNYVEPETELMFVIAGLSPDGKTLLVPQVLAESDQKLIFHGYSYHYREPEK